MKRGRVLGRYQALLAAVPALLLSACGGGSSDSAAAPATATGTSNTSTTVTPTPTPVATASYDATSNFSRDRSFNAIGLRVMSATSDTGTSTVDSRIDLESAAIGFTYSYATRAYHARYNDDALDVLAQPMTFTTEATYSYDQYLSSTPYIYFVRSPSAHGSNYVGYVSWATSGLSHYLLFGARTLAADLPTSGTKTYYEAPTGARGATITVDFAARTVSVATIYQPPAVGNAGSGINLPAAIPVTMAGTFDPATGRINGTVSFNGAAPSGVFEGAVYGPSAAEAGLLFKVQRPTGELYYGFLLGAP